MNRLALIGVSHRRGGAAALEAWQRLDAAQLKARGFEEFVPIVTCNRWDTLLRLPNGVSLAQARAHLTPAGMTLRPYAYQGEAAIEQLCRIASSLDSLNPGEDQIMAQVRESFALAQREGWTGHLSSFAFNSALRIAKRVRREIELAPMNTSLFSLARPRLESALAKDASVGIIGAGQMGTLAAKTLLQSGFGVTIINRDAARARQLSAHLHCESLSLAGFFAAPPELAALVCATSAANLITKNVVTDIKGLQIIVDMGIPRNVATDVTQIGVDILDIDTLQSAGSERREALGDKLAAAERLIQEELRLTLNEWGERQLGPSIKQLRDWYLETIQTTLGDSLPPEDAAKLAHKFAHVPVKGLRALARDYGPDAARVYLEETGLLDEDAVQSSDKVLG